MAKKLPWMKFSPEDYMRDTRSLSLEERGLYADLLCVMHLNVPRGRLADRHARPYSAEQIAALAACSTEEAQRIVARLLSQDIISQDEKGVLYNRRMVREEHKRERCSLAGRKGGGNPALQRPPLKARDKGPPKGASKGASRVFVFDPNSSQGEESVDNTSPSGGVQGGAPLKVEKTPLDFDLTAAGLAQAYAWRTRCPYPSDRDVFALTPVFEDLLEHGVQAEEIRAWIWDGTRKRHLPIFRFSQRWEKPNYGQVHDYFKTPKVQ